MPCKPGCACTEPTKNTPSLYPRFSLRQGLYHHIAALFLETVCSSNNTATRQATALTLERSHTGDTGNTGPPARAIIAGGDTWARVSRSHSAVPPWTILGTPALSQNSSFLAGSGPRPDHCPSA